MNHSQVDIFSKIAVSIFVAICIVIPAQVHAENKPEITLESLELGVSPATAFLKIEQGATASHTISLENTSSHTLQVHPRIVDFSSDNSTGAPVLSSDTSFSYLAEGQDPTSFETLLLQPKEKAALRLSFAVPANAPSKEYPLTILFETTLAQPAAHLGAGADIKTVIGSNLIVLVTDTDTLPTLLTLKSIESPILNDSFSSLTFTPVAHNDSYAASVASGTATIKNWRGTAIATLPVAPQVILGNSSRNLQMALSAQENSQFKYVQSFFFGWYTIEVVLTTGIETSPSQVAITKTIFFLPYSFTTVFFTFGVVGIFIFFRKRTNSLLQERRKKYYTEG